MPGINKRNNFYSQLPTCELSLFVQKNYLRRCTYRTIGSKNLPSGRSQLIFLSPWRTVPGQLNLKLWMCYLLTCHIFRAIEIDNSNQVYYCNRAAAFSKLDNHFAAIEDCKRAIDMDPRCVFVISELISGPRQSFFDALAREMCCSLTIVMAC